MHVSGLLASWTNTQLWYSIPLLVSISLVYGATRHERMGPILYHAWQMGKWMVGFVLVVMAILTLVSWAC